MTLIFYLLNRLIFRIVEFFKHWYIHSFRIYTHFVISILERFDRQLAWKITLKYIFEPLYQDRSVIGYTLGFIFRSIRLIIGSVIYALIIAAAVFFYLIWLAIPIYIIYKIVILGQ